MQRTCRALCKFKTRYKNITPLYFKKGFMCKLKFLSFILLLQFSAATFAQELYTDYLQKEKPGRGTVVLHQSKAITDLVNGLFRKTAGSRNTAGSVAKADSIIRTGAQDEADSLAGSAPVLGQRVRANGYRIQVFSGGNSRGAKNEAMMIGKRVKGIFPDIMVYTQFVSPHWQCRVGDFRTYEEANDMFMRLKETQSFKEAVIVKSKINVYY